MKIKKSTLAMAILSALVINGCGSDSNKSSSSASNSNSSSVTHNCYTTFGVSTNGVGETCDVEGYNTAEASKFSNVRTDGLVVSPSGKTAPTVDNAEVDNVLVVQYLDDDYRKGEVSTNSVGAPSLHLWDGGCDASTNTNTDWNDMSIIPTEYNDYGPVWHLNVSDMTKDGCMGVIVRSAGNESKLGTGNDMKLVWTKDDHTVTLTKYQSESVLDLIEAFNKQYKGGAELKTADASAHFLSKNVIAWGSADKDKYGSRNVRLQYNTEGLVEVDAEAKALNGKYIDLVKISVPEDLVAKHQNLKDFNFYQISDEQLATLDLKAMLRGEMLIVGLDSNNEVKTASKIQTAPLIDALYAEAATQVQDLGATVTSEGVTFKIWAPTAKSVKVHVWPSDNYETQEDGDMTFDSETGVWSYTSTEAGHGSRYKFQLEVYHPAVRKIADTWTTDPYTLTLDGGNSVVTDLNNSELKPDGWDDLTAPHSQATPADIAGMFITESHLRDLTVGDDKGIPSELQGKYVGLLDTTTNVGKHLLALSKAGVTHMEFLPMYDIASIDEGKVFSTEDGKKVADEYLSGVDFCKAIGVTETKGINVCNNTDKVYDILAQSASDYSYDKDNSSKAVSAIDTFLTAHVKDLDNFNWGYDPWHYGAPEGSYATDAKPMTRIKEIRQLFQAMKKDYGFNVIIDVVYNHTDGAGLEKDSSVLDRIVPWYYNRLNPISGNVNGDTCCSDSASENAMFAKLMEDTLVTWAKDYKVDAFRFDLMGYIPKDVMVNTLKNVKERSGNNEIYFFGEGWDAYSAAAVVGGDGNATQINMHGTGIGTFNDRLRDGMRGNGPFDHGDALIRLQGFASGRCTDLNAQRLKDNPGYSCDAYRTNAADYGMHPLNWQDVIRISMAGNLRDYPLVTYTGDTKTGKEIMYWASIAGYGDSPIETINYVSKHDNQTLFDLIMYKANTDRSMEDKAKMQAIGLASVILAQSPVFDQQGSDLLRTKFFQNDSYNIGDFGNTVNYDPTKGNGFIPGALVNKSKDLDDWGAILEVSKYNTDVGADVKAKMVDTYQKLATIRKEHNILHLGDAELIKNNVSFLNTGSQQTPGMIVMKVTKPAGVEDSANELYVMLNAAPTPRSFEVGVTEVTALDTGALNKDSCFVSNAILIAEPWSVCVFQK